MPTNSRCSGIGAVMEQDEQVSGAYRAPDAAASADAAVDQAGIAQTGTLHWHAGNRGEAMAAYQRALELLSGLPAPLEAAHLYQELGLAAFRNGDNTQAVEWADRALRSAEQALTEPAADAAHIRRAATVAIAQATNTIGVALARLAATTLLASVSSAVSRPRRILVFSRSRAVPTPTSACSTARSSPSVRSRYH